MNKKNKFLISFILILFFITNLKSLSNDEMKIVGSYQCKLDDDAAFFQGEYITYSCIILFSDSRYVKFTKKVNKNNSTDIKYSPESSGLFNISNDLIFLQPSSGLFEIYRIEINKIIGTYSELIYLKTKD